ncbi:hypothetical protein [Tenacibaculum sp. 190524A02b]|uniref:hypothetical protein n=1 Tax=Tenacibaculum vairaonense TaxID=3137860 RepID=UPI0031FB41CD
MKRVLFISFLFGCASLTAQESNFWNKVRFGGGFGLGFGNNNTTVAISPSAVYDFNEQFSLGLGVGYLYNKQNNFSSNVYSGSIISLYNPMNEIQLSAEFEHLFVNRRSRSFTENYNYPALYLGAAYRTGHVSFGIRYDVLYDKNKSIFASPISPIVRIFF